MKRTFASAWMKGNPIKLFSRSLRWNLKKLLRIERRILVKPKVWDEKRTGRWKTMKRWMGSLQPRLFSHVSFLCTTRALCTFNRKQCTRFLHSFVYFSYHHFGKNVLPRIARKIKNFECRRTAEHLLTEFLSSWISVPMSRKKFHRSSLERRFLLCRFFEYLHKSLCSDSSCFLVGFLFEPESSFHNKTRKFQD